MKLADARRYALSLPETAEEPHFELTSFRVRGKIFATAPPGTQELRIFVDEVERERALALHPGFIGKLFWGKKVAGLRVDLALAKAVVVKDLLQRAWANKAPKALASGLKK
jgi:hypothetical protein